ncbi:reverse transcriptase [Lasius niger]|uniref:Reverse transcriptase n=1 Tax=Lasius niger TaxID=67767 RepID=A0A0J7MNA1_LASNI|nr:reverse transcriptase [Lasius niger]
MGKRELELLNTIFNIAQKTGFPLIVIDKVFKNTRNNFYLKLNTPSNPKVSNTFHGALSYVPRLSEKLKTILKSNNVNVGIKSNPPLRKMLNRKLDPVLNSERNGIYKIPLTLSDNNNKQLFYIGLTKRKFSIRLKEHKNDIRFGRQTTALSRLHSKENIAINFEKARIIIPYHNFNEAALAETIEIIDYDNLAINDRVSTYLPRIWQSLLFGDRQCPANIPLQP